MSSSIGPDFGAKSGTEVCFAKILDSFFQSARLIFCIVHGLSSHHPEGHKAVLFIPASSCPTPSRQPMRARMGRHYPFNEKMRKWIGQCSADLIAFEIVEDLPSPPDHFSRAKGLHRSMHIRADHPRPAFLLR